MPDITFEWGKAKITVREQTGKDFFRLEILQASLQSAYRDSIAPQKMTNWNFADCNEVAPFILRSTVIGKLDFTWTPYDDSTYEQYVVMINGLLNSPLELLKAWREALNKADFEAPDPEELPGDEKSLKKSQEESSAG
jgi:hypothetical protein